MKKRLRFKRGIDTIHFPFILRSDLPWQDQVEKELERIYKTYQVSEFARFGYSITESISEITVNKY